MRKKCVRRTKFLRSTLVAAIAVTSALVIHTAAQSPDPSTLSLLSADSLQYLGGFRLPRESANGTKFDYGGRPIAFSPATNSLYVGSRSGRLAEVTIPAPVNSPDVTRMPFATYLQPFADPTEGHLLEVLSSGVAIDGLMVYGNKLVGTASVYYDANNKQRLSHYSRSLQLNEPSFSGWSQVWDTGKAGFVSGFLSLVPAEWRERLGGPAATGQCCVPIVSRTSWGPAAFAFDPARVGAPAVAASPLVYYTGEHPTLGVWSGSNPTYGATTQMGGLVIVGGTRTALYIGRNGTGPYCYGSGTGDLSLAGTRSADGSLWCYDPTSADKGTHAYPYRYQIWAYDLNDLAAVRAGTKAPWQVVPYGVWPFEVPTVEKTVRIGGVTYDPERQIIYFAQIGADKDGYASRPIIHAFQLDVPAAPPPAPIDSVAIAADKAAPQVTGTTITFTATPAGGVEPYQYQWLTSDGSTWTAAGDWTTANTFTWTPATANANYQVEVRARSSWNATDAAEATAATPFAINAPSIDNVAIGADKAAPQVTGTTITFTATPAGGVEPYQYQWFTSDGSTWTAAGGWTAANTFTWTPATANASYQVEVRARSSWNATDTAEATAATPFAINAPPPIDNVAIAADRAAPQVTGTAITFTATPAGGVGPYQYKWLTSDGSAWTAAGDWTAANTFTWTPATANANYQVGVWARSSWNATDAAEATAATPFAINTPVVAKLSSVKLTSDRMAPQATGTPITWTATPTGGTSLQYKWWVYNGYNWIVYSHWSTNNVFTWIPGNASSAYKVSVWVKEAANTRDAAEVSSGSSSFAISGTAVVVPPPPPQTSAKVLAVQIAPDAPAPQVAGATVGWTATATGGNGALLYKWWIFDGSAWVPSGSWTTSTTFAWKPAVPGAKYKVAVWAKCATNTLDAAEASTAFEYVITALTP